MHEGWLKCPRSSQTPTLHSFVAAPVTVLACSFMPVLANYGNADVSSKDEV